MSTESEGLMPPSQWHTQPMPMPPWLVVVALAFFGPGETIVSAAWPSNDYAVIAAQVEDLAERVEDLSKQVDALQSTDNQVAHVLAEVVRALDERGTE